jgi:uncharacterized protein (TIGR02118 family)
MTSLELKLRPKRMNENNCPGLLQKRCLHKTESSQPVGNKSFKLKYMSTPLRHFLLIFVIAGFLSCKTRQPTQTSSADTGTFKVAILYPNGEGKTFDMNYYENTHMPMVAGFIGKNLKYYEIDRGIAGRGPNDKAPFLAIGYFYIADVAQYNSAIAQNREAIVNDFKNYTNIQPVIQISERKSIQYPKAK